ncbi:MAG: transcriptional regulator [Gammaproteobacteria bacterium]|nr:MAG: transcriptional regulator [Gammaproteobacteria bacterium]
MPEISRFLGIIITMYWSEHNPPHFHAKYGEYKIVVHIKSGVVEGKFPKRALKMVMEWYEIHKNELLEDWELCTQRKMPNSIKPLE